MQRTVIVTGVSENRGRQVARALVQREQLRVLGLDTELVQPPIAGVEHVQADIRNPLLAELFEVEDVDTIVHTAFQPRQRRIEPVFEKNVVGTMRLFGAAAEAGVRKIVFPSTTMVYGAVPQNPAFIPETTGFQGQPRYSFVRELRELESFINGFRQQAADVIVTVLRFAHPLGPNAAGPLARWLSLPMPPAPLGFDPRIQVVHAEDVVAALVHAVRIDVPGTFNIAADDEILTLCQLVRMVGKVPAPIAHPLLYWGVDAGKALNPKLLSRLPLEPDYLRYACVGATERMRDDLGFTPQYTAREAVSLFAASLRTRRYAGLQDVSDALREQLQDVIDVRRNLRKQATPSEDETQE